MKTLHSTPGIRSFIASAALREGAPVIVLPDGRVAEYTEGTERGVEPVIGVANEAIAEGSYGGVRLFHGSFQVRAGAPVNAGEFVPVGEDSISAFNLVALESATEPGTVIECTLALVYPICHQPLEQVRSY